MRKARKDVFFIRKRSYWKTKGAPVYSYFTDDLGTVFYTAKPKQYYCVKYDFRTAVYWRILDVNIEREQLNMETKEVQKCAWCKREGEMKYAAIRGPRQYFCSDTCLQKWEWFNRNGQDWLNVKETNNGEKKN